MTNPLTELICKIWTVFRGHPESESISTMGIDSHHQSTTDSEYGHSICPIWNSNLHNKNHIKNYDVFIRLSSHNSVYVVGDLQASDDEPFSDRRCMPLQNL